MAYKVCFKIATIFFIAQISWSLWLGPFSSGFDENIESQGELILQESFQVWDPKTLIRKGRERHLFLFEMSLVFSKEVKDSSGRSKYLYKSKLFVSTFNLIELLVQHENLERPPAPPPTLFYLLLSIDLRAWSDRARGR